MPYIICVNQPGYLPEQDPYAVATLGEARDAATSELDYHGVDYASDEHMTARELPETGGVVGPLPDGYVIDVRPATYAELRKLAGIEGVELYGLRDERREQIIDAYNAER